MGNDIGVVGVTAFDADRNLVILQVIASGQHLPLADSVQPYEQIYVVGYVDRHEKSLMPSIITYYKSRDFCKAEIQFPITIDSDGGPVLNINGKVVGVFFSGALTVDPGFPELNASFVVPTSFLRKLLNSSGGVKGSFSIGKELDYCALISRANAKVRKARSVTKQGRYSDAQILRSAAEVDLEKAAKKLGKAKRIPWRQIFRGLKVAARLL